MRPSPTENTAKVLAVGLGRGQRPGAHYHRAGAVVAAQSRPYLTTGNVVRPRNCFARFISDQAGVTVIEYGIIAALISVVCIAGMTFVGAGLQGVYNAVSAAITPAL